MMTARGRVVGARIRFKDGTYRSVPGSTNALFAPRKPNRDDWLLICEGPTDTAMALALGFDAVGISNAGAAISYLKPYCVGRSCAIIADADKAGIRSAGLVKDAIEDVAEDVEIIIPPAKDLRSWGIAAQAPIREMLS